tara:strand:+ start:86 stop:247 length:162 start_codon:yes stop_codon:yes gene_type:complete
MAKIEESCNDTHLVTIELSENDIDRITIDRDWLRVLTNKVEGTEILIGYKENK